MICTENIGYWLSEEDIAYAKQLDIVIKPYPITDKDTGEVKERRTLIIYPPEYGMEARDD